MFITEIITILFLIILNGIFAMSEIAVVSARKSSLQNMANEGHKGAQRALKLADEPSRFLSTIQIGITLIGIFAGAFGGATIAESLGVTFNRVKFIYPNGEVLALFIVVVSITYLSVVFGEIIPKRIALSAPEKIASAVSRPMTIISRIVSPLVSFLSITTEKFVNVLGVSEPQQQPVTEDEILVLLEQGKNAGTFEDLEKCMVNNVFELSDKQVGSLMTPRNQIAYLDLEDTMEETTEIIKESIHNILPVCRDGLDNIVGIVQAKTLLSKILAGEVADLTLPLATPLFVPETMRVFNVFKSFKESGQHFALVTDEYGIVQGVLTLTDILEAIVGDIPTLQELGNPQATQRDDGSWLVDGMISIDDFKKIFHIDKLPEEESGSYQTLGGFIILELGKIPKVADSFTYHGYKFEIMDMDGNRVDKILLSKQP